MKWKARDARLERVFIMLPRKILDSEYDACFQYVYRFSYWSEEECRRFNYYFLTEEDFNKSKTKAEHRNQSSDEKIL